MKKLTLLIICILSSATLALAEPHLHQEKWCAENQGQSEVVLPGRTRCACEYVADILPELNGKKYLGKPSKLGITPK